MNSQYLVPSAGFLGSKLLISGRNIRKEKHILHGKRRTGRKN
jgi:hypothetical protein